MNWLLAIGPPLLMVLGGIVTWLLKSKVEELRSTEERLSAERRKVYAEILEPFMRLLADSQGKGHDQAIKMFTSKEYRRAAFELGLFASDEVVRAYNSLIKHVEQAQSADGQDPKQLMRLWGGLRLAIRKGLGNKKTKLNEYDMLRGMITGIDKFLSG
jgi:hypothetical protein